MPRNTKKPEDVSPPPKKPLLDRVSRILSLIFYIIWIPVGFVFLLSVYANFRQGAYSGLLNTTPPQSQQAATPPAEAELPGVGMVNVACVQQALSSETIQKVFASGNTSDLSDDEKSKLEPCVVTPAASPSPTS